MVWTLKQHTKRKMVMFPAGIEPATLRVWGARDNHYTTETRMLKIDKINGVILFLYVVSAKQGFKNTKLSLTNISLFRFA